MLLPSAVHIQSGPDCMPSLRTDSCRSPLPVRVMLESCCLLCAGLSWKPDTSTTVWELFSLTPESRKVWEEHAARKVDSDLVVDVFCPPGGTVKQVTLKIR